MDQHDNDLWNHNVCFEVIMHNPRVACQMKQQLLAPVVRLHVYNELMIIVNACDTL